MPIESLEGKWKLGQNRPEADRNGAIEGLRRRATGRDLAANQWFVLQVLFVLILLSLAVIGITLFVQTSKSLMSGRASYDPIGRVFQVVSLGAILSEQHAVFGLILTFLSGSVFYQMDSH